jgi:hypothetical protein
MSYIPGRALIYSRLPDQRWFSLDEAAMHSGWSRSFIRARIKTGKLTAQKFQTEGEDRRPHFTYKIHVDDLVVFIMQHASGRFSEEKPFRDVVSIVRAWPLWMIREMHRALGIILAAKDAQRQPTAACGESARSAS